MGGMAEPTPGHILDGVNTACKAINALQYSPCL